MVKEKHDRKREVVEIGKKYITLIYKKKKKKKPTTTERTVGNSFS